MAIKQRPTANLMDRYEAWIERNAPTWLAKTLLFHDGGLFTPTESAHETRWFTKLLLALSLVALVIVTIERFWL